MASTKSVQNTHISLRLRELHAALMDIVAVINRPARDEVLIREAGLRLDRALFPLLVGVGRLGPVGVVELADRIGRDHTTVSRQMAKLEELGLIHRRAGTTDRRLREAVITPEGRAMTEAVDAARDRIGRAVLAGWAPGDVDDLVRLVGRYADAVREPPSDEAVAAAAAGEA